MRGWAAPQRGSERQAHTPLTPAIKFGFFMIYLVIFWFASSAQPPEIREYRSMAACVAAKERLLEEWGDRRLRRYVRIAECVEEKGGGVK